MFANYGASTDTVVLNAFALPTTMPIIFLHYIPKNLSVHPHQIYYFVMSFGAFHQKQFLYAFVEQHTFLSSFFISLLHLSKVVSKQPYLVFALQGLKKHIRGIADFCKISD